MSNDGMIGNIGVIEGFFGREWSWEEREDTAAFLRQLSAQFYIYAPKGDAFLRKNWQGTWPVETQRALGEVVDVVHEQGLSFGFGLSPFELYLDTTSSARERLRSKVDELNAFGAEILCILFDDMKGDVPGLAQLQTDIIHDVAGRTNAKHLLMCPSYYSFDPVLERVFGKMPEGYLADLGRLLDPQIDIFWTGPLVCSKEYPVSHLEEVQTLLKRKPFLWDNYPVNDGARMSRFLHLGAFEGRSHHLAGLTSGHAINPMNQAYLSRIPMYTLAESYRQKELYEPKKAFQDACLAVCGPALGAALIEDFASFQELGLDQLDEAERDRLRQKYAQFGDNPFAKEVLGWLNEVYLFDPACLTG